MEVPFPAEATDFSPVHSVHIGSSSHPVSYLMDIGPLSTGVQQPGREANYPRPYNVHVTNTWSYIFALSTPS
jgi:hypothetical protein